MNNSKAGRFLIFATALSLGVFFSWQQVRGEAPLTTTASPAEQLCIKTGGHYSRREDCPKCPEKAVCEACFVGCQCQTGKKYDKTMGCK